MAAAAAVKKKAEAVAAAAVARAEAIAATAAAVAAATKAARAAYCTKISFSVMDIIKGIGNFLSWMMKPIEKLMDALFSALGIALPTLPEMPWFPLGLPDLDFEFLFDWEQSFPIPYADSEDCRRSHVEARTRAQLLLACNRLNLDGVDLSMRSLMTFVVALPLVSMGLNCSFT